MKQKISVVTGASQGIGFEICRQLAQKGITVVLTARNLKKGETAVQKLQKEGLHVSFYPLDVTKQDDIQSLVTHVKEKFGRVDILVNNAGVHLNPTESALTVALDIVKRSMEADVYGHLLLCQKIIPLMRQHHYGRIVNMSSKAGQLATMGAKKLGYKMSKAALNVLTAVLADEVKGNNILINSMTPGWVRTEMGGSEAPRSIEEGADTAIWLATLPDDGPTGGFFYEHQPIPW
ncbi:MAG: short-chain dehydrogenase [Candidatus Parabeggiatoa sp. nov. 1]|nr:MAG: short-chain dehydrogenase [Gammaproteobacteria bacterium]